MKAHEREIKNARSKADERNRTRTYPQCQSYSDYLYFKQKARRKAKECEAPPEDIGPHCNDGECNHCEYGPKEDA